jgi:hypothetical protein
VTDPVKPVPLPPVVAGVPPVTGAVTVKRLPATGARLNVKVMAALVALAYVLSAAFVAVIKHVPLVAALRVALAALVERAQVVADPSATV